MRRKLRRFRRTSAGVQATPPVVNAGPDQSIDISVTANLDGTVTYSGTFATLWAPVQVPIPGGVTFGDATVIDTTAVFSHIGIYALRLTANDGALQGFDDVQITVTSPPNQAPVVNAGTDQTVSIALGANLSGTVTDDGLGNPPGVVTITWSKFSGPGAVTFGNPAAVQTTAQFSAVGTYDLQLLADDGLLSANDHVIITVQAASAGWTVFSAHGGGGIVDLIQSNADATGNLWYCFTDISGGPFRSDDGGQTWADKGGIPRVSTGSFVGGMGNRNVVALDPTNINTVYMAFLPKGCLPRNVYDYDGVWKSTDKGETWAQLLHIGAKTISRGTIICDNTGALYGFVSNSSQFWVSTDGGINFTSKTAPITARAGDHDTSCSSTSGGLGAMIVAVAPNNRIFYVDPVKSTNSTTGGLWYSDNLGNNWTRVTSLDGARTVSEIACHPGDNNRVLAAVRDNTTGKLEIWVSSNNGTSFARDQNIALTMSDLGESSRGCVAINRTGTALLFPQGAFNSSRPSARSTANGDIGTWTTYVPNLVAGGNYVYATSAFTNSHRMIAHPGTGINRFVACNLTSIIISLDGGSTWKQYAQGIGVVGATGLAIDSTDPNIALFTARDVGMIRTANGGLSWTDVNAQNNADGYGVAQDPTLTTRWYRIRFDPPTKPNCVFQESLDRGVTWTTLSSPSGFAVSNTAGPQMSIVIDPNNAQIIYVGWSKSSPGINGLYRSTNRGSSFALVPNSNKLTNIVRSGRHLYGFSAAESTGTGGDLLKFNMDTDLWTTLRNTGNVNGFCIHPTNDQIMWVCEGTIQRVLSPGLSSTPKGVLSKSTNGGTTWTTVQRNGKNLSPNKVYIDTNNPNIMLMSGFFEDPDGTFHGVQFSSDAGVTWSDLASDLPQSNVVTSFIYGGVPGRVYAMTHNSGVFRMDALY